jgi:Sigma-70, region 4
MKITIQQRNSQMVEMRRKGQTLEEIGLHFGVTRERARQIIKDINPTLVAREVGKIKRKVKAAKVAEGRNAIRAKLDGDWDNLSHLTLAEISTKLRISQVAIKDAITKKRLAILQGNEHRDNANLQQFTDAEIKKALRDAEALVKPLTAARYTGLLKAGKISGPTVARLHQRFGSWIAACEFARVRAGKAMRTYSREWSNQRLFEILVEFLSDPSAKSDTYDAFADWLRVQPGNYPSAQTVRNNLGAWRIIKADALHRLPRTKHSKS